MNHKLNSLVAACLAVGSTAALALTNDEHKAEMEKVEATAKADKKACAAMKDNARDICKAEAKGREKIAKAELEQRFRPSPKNEADVKSAKANATYDVAKEKCEDQKGAAQATCKKEAKAAHESAKADMKAEKKAEKAVPAKAANANKG